MLLEPDLTAGACAARTLHRPTPAGQAGYRIVNQLQQSEAAELLRLRNGLLASRPHIDPKYFYDATGCALFNSICLQPEYYLTRTEAKIFARHRMEIARHLPAGVQWIDLGCGDGLKSKPWIAAVRASRYMAVDIAPEALERALGQMAALFPALDCAGVLSDFSHVLCIDEIIAERPHAVPVMFYPGSSLGNFTASQALALLKCFRQNLGARGFLLIGIDLIKDARLLQAAYDDAQGVTAAFNRNVLRVVNRLLDADFDPQRFGHCATFDRQASRIEMRLRSTVDQWVLIGSDARKFRAGESILTEYSHKYTVKGFADLLCKAGFARQRVWTDEAGWFGVFLASG